MSHMFHEATAFSQNLCAWGPHLSGSSANVEGMFEFADRCQSTSNPSLEASPVSPLCHHCPVTSKSELQTAIGSWISSGGTDTTFGPTINDWDVSRVRDFSSLFDGRSTFNDPINDWQTSQVANMAAMFKGATSFNPIPFSNSDPPALSSWDVSSVVNFNCMFQESGFNQNINNWNVGSATNMAGMFRGAASFNQPLNNWDVSKVTVFEGMFSHPGVVAGTPLVFNQNIGMWDVSSATLLRGMFSNNDSFNQDLSGWDVSKVVGFRYMFSGATAHNQDLCAWGTKLAGSGATVTDMFTGSDCPATSPDPNLAASPVSPLCHVCS